MVGIRNSQVIQYGRGQTSSTTTCSTFETCRAQLYQSWNEEGFISLDQEFLICEMADPSTSRSARVTCAEDIKKKIDRENRKIGYEGQMEEPYLGGKMQRTRGHIQSNDQPHSQVGVAESPNNTKEEYLQLHFIPSLQSERIPVFEVSLRRSNAVAQMYQQLMYLNFPI